MRYRFTAGAALLGALALSLTLAMVPMRAAASVPRLAQARGLTQARGPAQARGLAARPAFLPASRISRACRGQNAAPQEAADSTGHHVSVVWEGCRGIGFARSADGGARFRGPVHLPASSGGFDPAVAVAPNGTVYAVFMKQTAHHQFPVVDASFDHGRSFPQVARLIPRQLGNFGGRPFIAAAPNDSVYVSWDHGPSAAAVSYICTPAAAVARSRPVISTSCCRNRTISG